VRFGTDAVRGNTYDQASIERCLVAFRRFSVAAFTRWLSALLEEFTGGPRQLIPAPLPKTHPPGRAAGALRNDSTLPADLRDRD
jgi:hypothetical protein